MNSLSLAIPGNLGVDVGAGADGVLIGSITHTAVGAAIRGSKTATNVAAFTDDGGLYVDDSTDFNDAGTADVQPLPTTPANDDAFYVGADAPFSRVDFDVGTAGDGSWTSAWEVWVDGSGWTAVTGLTDPTSGFSAGSTGLQSVTYTQPANWVKNTVDSVEKYWLRLRVVAFTSIVTPAVLDQGFVVLDTEALTDDTTDANSAATGDVAVTSSFPVVGDRFYTGHADKFAKARYDIGTAATGTLTFTWKYWDGSAWAALTVDDQTVDFSASAGIYVVSFEPPADWATTTIGSFTGYLILAEVATASGATAPVLDQAWVLPLTAAAAVGVTVPPSTANLSYTRAFVNALTASASGIATKLIILNATSGVFVVVTWTAAVAALVATIGLPVVAGDEIVVLQVSEQGTTEFANANLVLLGP